MEMASGEYENDWQVGLCESLSKGHCCEAFFCPCLMFGKIRKNLNHNKSSVDASAAYFVADQVIGGSITGVLQFLLRGEVRDEKRIKGGVVNDFCVSGCCGPCALTQMEVETRESIPEQKPLAPSWERPLDGQQTLFKMDGFWKNTMS
jgi:Cys-rich protein (TIGR01571 family)